MTAPVWTGAVAAARCLALDQTAVEVITALEQANVPVVLLKGPGLASRLYVENPDTRQYCDIDLLVAPELFERAEEVVALLGLTSDQVGWREDEMLWRERSWRRPGAGSLTVDLHRSFAGVSKPVAFWELISSSAEPFLLSGAVVRVPDTAGCALLVGLHAARPGNSTKALADLVAALELFPEPVWDEAAALAQETGSVDAFGRGLSRDPVGAAQVARLHVAPHSSLLDIMAARQEEGTVLSLAQLLQMSGWRVKLTHTARRLVPSPAYMRYNAPMANRGGVGLTASYLVRAGRIAVQTPTAALTVRRTRRQQDSPRGRVNGRSRIRHRVRLASVVSALEWRDQLLCAWTLLALHHVRRQLATSRVDDLVVRIPPPRVAPRAGTVHRTLRHQGANCLETGLVLQRWLASRGLGFDLLIGVGAPAEGFRAHAWLDRGALSDTIDDRLVHLQVRADLFDSTGLVEIHRRPTPAKWLSIRGS